MPVSAGEAQMVFHLLPGHYFIRIVPAECQWIITLRAFVLNLAYAFEIFFVACKYHNEWI
jgi:hypothetical protein